MQLLPQHLWKNLKNFLLYNYYTSIGKYKYPNSILPKNYYRRIIEIDKILKTQELITIRRSKKKENEIFNDCGILRDDVIIDKDIPGLSMNLLGSKYKINYIKYVPKIKTKATEEWNGIEAVYISEFFKCYSVLDEYSAIFFNVSDLHNVNIPYNKKKDDSVIQILRKLSLKYEISENGQIKSEGKALVEHVPIYLNYWHLELKLLDFNGNQISKASNQFNKHIVSFMLLQYLKVKAVSNPRIVIPSISKIDYKKNS